MASELADSRHLDDVFSSLALTLSLHFSCISCLCFLLCQFHTCHKLSSHEIVQWTKCMQYSLSTLSSQWESTFCVTFTISSKSPRTDSHLNRLVPMLISEPITMARMSLVFFLGEPDGHPALELEGGSGPQGLRVKGECS